MIADYDNHVRKYSDRFERRICKRSFKEKEQRASP